MSRRVLVIALVGASVLAACASGEQASTTPADAKAWSTYRAEVVPMLDRVLGPTEGAADACSVYLGELGTPRFGLDLRPTLRSCAQGDLSTARQTAHRQLDHIATNDHATGRLP